MVLTLFMLQACSQEKVAQLSPEQSATLQPQQSELADIYLRSCKNCHTVAGTGAPLTGDNDNWSIRMDKGMPTLVDNVINGFGGMPPFGMCMDCEPEQFEQLIQFMAQGPKQH